jgi:site-specific recombinase XerD
MKENYIDYITYIKQYSQETISNYKKALKKLDSYLATINKSVDDPESIKLIDIYNFIEDMSKS